MHAVNQFSKDNVRTIGREPMTFGKQILSFRCLENIHKLNRTAYVLCQLEFILMHLAYSCSGLNFHIVPDLAEMLSLFLVLLREYSKSNSFVFLESNNVFSYQITR